MKAKTTLSRSGDLQAEPDRPANRTQDCNTCHRKRYRCLTEWVASHRQKADYQRCGRKNSPLRQRHVQDTVLDPPPEIRQESPHPIRDHVHVTTERKRPEKSVSRNKTTSPLAFGMEAGRLSPPAFSEGWRVTLRSCRLCRYFRKTEGWKLPIFCRKVYPRPPLPTRLQSIVPPGNDCQGNLAQPLRVSRGGLYYQSLGMDGGSILSSIDRHRSIFRKRLIKRGVVAQLVRAPDCRSGGCGFEPRRPR